MSAPAGATSGEHFDAVVIGAGLSGLAAGIRIAMYGKRVAVCEKHYLWGGLNSFYKRGGRLFDTGLHALTNFVDRRVSGKPLTLQFLTPKRSSIKRPSRGPISTRPAWCTCSSTVGWRSITAGLRVRWLDVRCARRH